MTVKVFGIYHGLILELMDQRLLLTLHGYQRFWNDIGYQEKGGGGGGSGRLPCYFIIPLTKQCEIFLRYSFILECVIKGKVDQISFVLSPW